MPRDNERAQTEPGEAGQSDSAAAGACRPLSPSSPRTRTHRGRGLRLFLGYSAAVVIAYVILLPKTAGPGFAPWGPGDFACFYTAAHIVRAGNAHRLYDLSLQTQVQQSFLLPHGWTFLTGLFPYINPPFVVVVFIPLSFLPLGLAFHIWNIFNFVLIFVCVRLLLQCAGKRSPRALILATIVVLAFYPVYEVLYKGQISLVVLLALVLTYLALKKGEDHAAGAVLALGLVKPQLVILVAAVLLFRRRWRAVLSFGVVGFVLFLVSWMIAGVDGLASYVKLGGKMLQWDGLYGIYPIYMFNLQGTVYRLARLYHLLAGANLSVATLSAITLGLSGLVLAWALRIWKAPCDPTSPKFDLQFGQAITIGLLLSPHLYGHDLVLLILVGFLLFNYLVHLRRTAEAYRLLAIGHVTPALSLALTGVAGQAQAGALLLLACIIVFDRLAR